MRLADRWAKRHAAELRASERASNRPWRVVEQTRYFCPSCHQKRVILYGEWVEENVLAPVAHRQYVFTVPRLLRPIFSRQRAWLGELCRIAARLLSDAYAEAAPGARPGLILFVQTFGDLANFNPHLHVLCSGFAPFRPHLDCKRPGAGARCSGRSARGHVISGKPLSQAGRAKRGGIDSPIRHSIKCLPLPGISIPAHP